MNRFALFKFGYRSMLAYKIYGRKIKTANSRELNFSPNQFSFQLRQLRQSAFQDNYTRGRLNNFPANEHQMQTIFYPGSDGVPQRYIEPAAPAFSLPIPEPVKTTTTTTTTTPYPVIFETRRAAPRRPNAPATAPIATVHAPARRRRPQSNVVENRTENRLGNRSESRFENRVESSIEDNTPTTEDEEARIYREEQARNAHYTFGSSIDDSINDHSIHRQETRNGLALKGMYSYSDGWYKRTIHYEADENGYRVVK